MKLTALSRPLTFALLALLPVASLAVLVPTPAAAAWTPPAGCTASGSHVTCVWNKPASPGSFTLTVPNGTTQLETTAVGQYGGSAPVGGAAGGRPDVVTGVLTVTGGEVITVSFPDDGGAGHGGAGHGGDSTRVSRAGTLLAVAAGGGGAGNGATLIGDVSPSPGGAGGDAASAGADGSTAAGAPPGPRGGGGATGAVSGTGGSGGGDGFSCFGYSGVSGTSSVGGSGGADFGGGGGGGVRGGGGGGGAGLAPGFGYCHTGAGGGGGASLVPAFRGSRALATPFDGSSRVAIEFDLAGVAQVSPASIAFGIVKVGETSGNQSVILTNTGDGPLAPGTSTLTGPFQRTDGCAGVTVPPGGSCTIQVRFAPTSTGSVAGTLSIPSNAANGTRTVSLSGTGGVPVASLTPTSIAFPSTAVGSTTAYQTATLRNTGNAAMLVRGASLGGAHVGDFVVGADNCEGAMLAPNATCAVQTAFRPTAGGARSASLEFITDAAGSPHVTTLSGTGLVPAISTPSSMAFGSQTLGGAGNPQSLVISNTGQAPLAISAVSVLGAHSADFVVGNACVTTIAPGASCTATLSFRPLASGARSATLRITSNAPTGPRDVGLAGTGVATTAVLFRGPGSYYTTADEAKATITVADHGNVAQYYVKVTNTGATATSYNFVLDKSGTNSNAQVNIKGGAILALDANGNWATPVIQPGKYREFAVKVTPNGSGQSISNVLVNLRHPNGALASRSYTETNTDAPLKGTDSFGLFAKAGSQRWVGGSFDGQTTTNQSLALNQTATFTTRLRNDGTTARSLIYSVAGSTNACWTRVVKVGTTDVTGAATGAGYVTKTLNPGQYLDVKVLVKRVATTGCAGIQFTAQTRDNGVLKHFSHLLTNPKA